MSLIGKRLLRLSNNKTKRPIPQVIPSYERAERVGILYTYEGDKKEEATENLISLINKEKQVDVLCYLDRKDLTNSKHPSFRIDQLNRWGKLNSSEAEEFLNTSYDYLIHLDFELNEIMKNMLIHTKAKCRVGFHTESGRNFYELMIGMNKSSGTSNFAEQIIKYIKAIR